MSVALTLLILVFYKRKCVERLKKPDALVVLRVAFEWLSAQTGLD